MCHRMHFALSAPSASKEPRGTNHSQLCHRISPWVGLRLRSGNPQFRTPFCRPWINPYPVPAKLSMQEMGEECRLAAGRCAIPSSLILCRQGQTICAGDAKASGAQMFQATQLLRVGAMKCKEILRDSARPFSRRRTRLVGRTMMQQNQRSCRELSSSALATKKSRRHGARGT